MLLICCFKVARSRIPKNKMAPIGGTWPYPGLCSNHLFFACSPTYKYHLPNATLIKRNHSKSSPRYHHHHLPQHKTLNTYPRLLPTSSSSSSTKRVQVHQSRTHAARARASNAHSHIYTQRAAAALLLLLLSCAVNFRARARADALA